MKKQELFDLLARERELTLLGLAKWVKIEAREARRAATMYAKKKNSWNESHYYGQVTALDKVLSNIERSRMKTRPIDKL